MLTASATIINVNFIFISGMIVSQNYHFTQTTKSTLFLYYWTLALYDFHLLNVVPMGI